MESQATVQKIDHYSMIKNLSEYSRDDETYLVRDDQDGLIYAIKLFQ